MSLRGQLGRFRKQEAHLQASDAPGDRPPLLRCSSSAQLEELGRPRPGWGACSPEPARWPSRAEHTLHCTKDLVVLSLSCVAFNRF